ncbi:hypothetical protein HY008_02115 [Candidatus Woesebacteria bacterium]|nr:hypothetical protein [Candidatus Woesebacteria bacterium]
MKIGSIWEPEDRRQAALFAREGQAIALFNRGVCAILGDGENEKFVEKVATIKGGERKDRPLAGTVRTEELVEIIDRSLIPQKYHELFLNSQELSSRIGSLCFVRVPILETSASEFPTSMVKSEDGKFYFQNWDPWGHYPVWSLIEEMVEMGIKYPAITSLNVSGEAEIVEQEEGASFAENSGIPIFLKDARDFGRVRGSYAILGVSNEGLSLVRHGNVPVEILEFLLDKPVLVDGAKGPNFPQHEFPSSLIENLSPPTARSAIIFYLQGRSVENIRSVLERRTTRLSDMIKENGSG